MTKKIWLKTYNFLINSKTMYEDFHSMQQGLKKIHERSIFIKRNEEIKSLNYWKDKGVYTDTEFNDKMNYFLNWGGPTHEEIMQSVVICSLEPQRKTRKLFMEY